MKVYTLFIFIVMISLSGQNLKLYEDMEKIKILKNLSLVDKYSKIKNRLENLEVNFTSYKLGFHGQLIRGRLYGNYVGYQIYLLKTENSDHIAELFIRSIDFRGYEDVIKKKWNVSPKEENIEYKCRNKEVFQKFSEIIETKLGKIKKVYVGKLNKDYFCLMYPYSLLYYGGGRALFKCKGRKAIENILKENRIDLIKNILRGYNPTGRIYAAEALLMKEKIDTNILDKEDRRVINIIFELEVSLSCIDFDIVKSYTKTKDIIHLIKDNAEAKAIFLLFEKRISSMPIYKNLKLENWSNISLNDQVDLKHYAHISIYFGSEDEYKNKKNQIEKLKNIVDDMLGGKFEISYRIYENKKFWKIEIEK